MTTIEMTRSDSAAGKSPGCDARDEPDEQAARQPGDPAADPERGELHAAGEMPNDAAARSLSRTAIIERPSRLRCRSATATSTDAERDEADDVVAALRAQRPALVEEGGRQRDHLARELRLGTAAQEDVAPEQPRRRHDRERERRDREIEARPAQRRGADHDRDQRREASPRGTATG